MTARVFISQSDVDNWVSSDQVELLGDSLRLGASGLALRLAPASYFLRIAGGADSRALIGKVKDQEAIAALGGEAYMNSVVVGETAYEVEPGFLATPAAPTDTARLVSALRALGA